MLKRLATIVAIAAISAQVNAGDALRNEAKETVELRDGSTLYVFRDGKMAVENRYGQPISIRPNTELEAKDGRMFVIQSNEVGRLEWLERQDNHY